MKPKINLKYLLLLLVTVCTIENILAQENSFYQMIVNRDTALENKILSETNEASLDLLINFGEKIKNNPSHFTTIGTGPIASNAIANLNLKFDKLSSRIIYCFLLYRDIQERNGNFNYDASNKLFNGLINNYSQTRKILLSCESDSFVVKSLLTLIAIETRRGKPIDRFLYLHLADSINRSISNSQNKNLQNHIDYFCSIGQYSCSEFRYNNANPLLDSIDIDYKIKPLNDINRELVLDEMFNFTDESKLPILVEQDAYIELLYFNCANLQLNENEKLEIARKIINLIDSSEKQFQKYIEYALNSAKKSSIELNNSGKKINRKYAQELIETTREFESNDSRYISKEFFLTYRASLLNKILTKFLIKETYKYTSKLDSQSKPIYDSLFGEFLKITKQPGNIYVLPQGDFSRINWSIISDAISTHSTKKITFYRTITHEKKKYKIQPNSEFAIISNLDFNAGLEKKPQKLKMTRGSTSAGYWSELPGTKKEAEIILKYYTKANNYQQHISKSQINKIFSKFEVIHIGTHSAYIPTNSGHNSSFLVLDSVNYLSRFQDSQIERKYYDIGDLRLVKNFNAKLVVLSACNSGAGKSVNSTMAINMPSMLLAKGSDFVISSQWEVSDSEITDFFDLFYKHLSSNPDVLESFSFARNEMKKLNHSLSVCYSFDLILK